MPPTPLLMINNKDEFSLNANEIEFIDEIGGVKELLSFLDLKKSNLNSMYQLISILFSKIKHTCEKESKIKTLYYLTHNINKSYQTVYITKSNGKKREINKPCFVLKEYQKAIYKNILTKIPVSAYATAYQKGSSLRYSTAVHTGKPMILKLDIKNFFGSILYKSVQEMFADQGYDYFISTTLATLCCYRGRLPQGTSTSPAISNIIMKEFDEKTAAFCRERNIAYTRYSDDMTFSGEFDKAEIIAFVENDLNKLGFILNTKKTKLIKQGQRQTVTGVVVNEKQQLPKGYRKKIRQELYYCQKHSVKSHILHANLTEYIRPNGDVYYKEYLLNLYGRINYALQINPCDAEMLNYSITVKSAMGQLEIVKRKINDEIFNLAAEFDQNKKRKDNDIYSYLKQLGYTEEEIDYSGIDRHRADEYYPVYDEKANIVGLLDFNCKVINKNYDTFFGFNFDKNVKCIILTLEKEFVFRAKGLGLKNVVSFLAEPNNFILTQNKLDFIKEYGNTVILHGEKNDLFECIRQKLINNNVVVL